MIWHKDLGIAERDNFYGYLFLIGLAAFVFSLIMERPLLLIIAVILFVFVFVSKLYDKHIGTKLQLRNNRTSIRLFAEKDGSLTLTFQNDSIIPIKNGTLTFLTSNKMEIENVKGIDIGENERKFSVPISIVGKGETKLTLPLKGNGRGVFRLRNITLTFPHLVHYQAVNLRFLPAYLTEIIIYPKTLPVSGVKEAYFHTIGEQRANFSPFEDSLNPIGTRDYVRTDPFSRINWKASVRKQTLQTKVLEKTINNTWIIVVNVSTKSRLGQEFFTKDMENLLSYVAYLIHYATKMGIPFEIYLNTRKGNRLFLGQGQEHLKNGLQFLANVKTDFMIVPFANLLKKLDYQLHQPHTVILLGESFDEVNVILGKWKRQGMNIFQVKQFEQGAVMNSVTKVGDTA